MRTTLRSLAGGYLVTGAALLAASGWFSDQLGLAGSTVQVIGAVSLVLGADLLLFQEKGWAPRAAMAVESIVAVAAIDLLIVGDPTGIGVVLLVGTILYGVAAVVRLVGLSRSPARSVTEPAAAR